MLTNVSRPSAVDVLRPFAVGDLFTADTTSTLSKVAVGSAGNLLGVAGGIPAWTSVIPPAYIAGAIELLVASIANPTELNVIGTAVPDWRLCHTDSAGSDPATLYRLEANTDAVSAPYIMASATAGLRWVAITGNYQNQNFTTAGGVTTGGNVTCGVSVNAVATVNSGPTGSAKIGLDANGATGNFTFRFSPANLTASRRATWSDADYNFTGGGTLALGGFTLTIPATGTAGLLGTAQTWSAANIFSSTVELNTSSNGLTISKTTGQSLIVRSTQSATSPTNGAYNIGDGSTLATNISMGAGNLYVGTAMVIGGGANNAQFFVFNVSGDTNNRLTAYNSGLMSFGSGSAPADINMYRSGTSMLTIDSRVTLGTIGSTFSGSVFAGVQDATADTAGAVGEVVQGTNQTTYTNFTTTATYQQLAVLTSLPRGRYRIVGTVTYYGNAATVAAIVDAIFAISTTTASAAGAVEGRSLGYITQPVTSSTNITMTIDTDINISAATSYYLNGRASFTVGNPQYVASITAYRLR